MPIPKLRYLIQGSFRKVYSLHGCSDYVVKIDRGGKSCEIETNLYEKYHQKVHDATKGKVRLAESFLLSPHVELQERVGGKMAGKEIELLKEILADSNFGFLNNDMHEHNFKKDRRTYVLFDFAGC